MGRSALGQRAAAQGNGKATPTDFTFTGQRSNVGDTGTGAGFGLMYYNARYYAPGLGRFASADTVVPGAGNPGAFDRYAYVFNNPGRFNDPSGNKPPICGEKYSLPDECVSPPTPVDESLLDDKHGFTTVSGRDVYNWYLA